MSINTQSDLLNLMDSVGKGTRVAQAAHSDNGAISEL
jgi:hypothetical protein